jgi:hypothetical protein
MDLVQDRDRQRVLVNALINRRGSQNAENFSKSCGPRNFSSGLCYM